MREGPPRCRGTRARDVGGHLSWKLLGPFGKPAVDEATVSFPVADELIAFVDEPVVAPREVAMLVEQRVVAVDELVVLLDHPCLLSSLREDAHRRLERSEADVREV